ncbi:MAG: M28 family peptidase [Candidatus Thorarchaeota archaeon]
MRRLWVGAALFLLLFLPTQVLFSPVDEESSQSVHSPSASNQPNILKRVYGEDLSYEIYTKTSADTIRDFVQKFTENGSRYIMEEGMADRGINFDARNYLARTLESITDDRVEIDIVGRYRNIVARLPGYLPGDNPVFVISAHYDSPEDSPGANCDGSGIAVMLALADIMADYEWPLDIYFIAFNGLFGMKPRGGSPQVVNWFSSNDIDILALYNVDTILVPDNTLPMDERIQLGFATGTPYRVSHYWADLARMVSNNIGSNMILPVPSGSFPIWSSSDHYSFYEDGIYQVTCAFESGLAIDTSYHNQLDTWDNVRFSYEVARELTGALGGCMAFTMGRALGETTHRNESYTIGSGSAKIIYIPITTPTTINVSCRWFGGTSSFYLVDPLDNVIASAEFNHTSAWERTRLFSKSVTATGLYKIVSYNSYYRTVGYDLYYEFDSDIDGNGVMDSQEYWLDNALWNSDQDGDGLSDAKEITLGTDINNVDTDGDVMPDLYELENGFDPRDPSDGNADADGDGLSNAQEYTAGLNPHSADTDSDHMPDLWELENGLNPLVDDSQEDPDGDGVTNLEEYEAGTDPQQAPAEEHLPYLWWGLPVLVVAPIVALLYRRRALLD